jgi:hypothetical protein
MTVASRIKAPTTEKRTVPGRLPNTDYRTREYLTEREVERLMKAAADNRHGHRDATMILLAFRHGLRASPTRTCRPVCSILMLGQTATGRRRDRSFAGGRSNGRHQTARVHHSARRRAAMSRCPGGSTHGRKGPVHGTSPALSSEGLSQAIRATRLCRRRPSRPPHCAASGRRAMP